LGFFLGQILKKVWYLPPLAVVEFYLYITVKSPLDASHIMYLFRIR